MIFLQKSILHRQAVHVLGFDGGKGIRYESAAQKVRRAKVKIKVSYCNPPQVARLQPMFSLLSATCRYNFEYKLNWRYLF